MGRRSQNAALRIGAALLLAVLAPGCRRGPAPEPPPSPAPQAIPELDRSGYPVLREEEVGKLAALRERHRELDVTRTDIFTFEFRYQEDRGRIDRVLAAAGLTKREYARLMVDVQKILADRVRILEPFDRLVEGGGAGQGKLGDIAEKAEKVRAGVALLRKHGFLDEQR